MFITCFFDWKTQRHGQTLHEGHDEIRCSRKGSASQLDDGPKVTKINLWKRTQTCGEINVKIFCSPINMKKRLKALMFPTFYELNMTVALNNFPPAHELWVPSGSPEGIFHESFMMDIHESKILRRFIDQYETDVAWFVEWWHFIIHCGEQDVHIFHDEWVVLQTSRHFGAGTRLPSRRHSRGWNTNTTEVQQNEDFPQGARMSSLWWYIIYYIHLE